MNPKCVTINSCPGIKRIDTIYRKPTERKTAWRKGAESVNISTFSDAERIMKKNKQGYVLLETEAQLNRFYTESQHLPWLAFDTEFIPEKYYRYKLCVISINNDNGNFLIDALKLKNIRPFIKLIDDPAILKITHAGENDYQLLVNDYDARPVNVFDTQLSYGFLQYDYPIGLQVLLSRELNVKLTKCQLKSDWERRPLTPEQSQYAVEDVAYLHPLMEGLKRRLKRMKKLHWSDEENKRLEDPDFYRNDPLDFLNNSLVNQLKKQEQVFLLRMHLWRHLEAEKVDRPVTQVLKTRVLNTIVQKMPMGKTALMRDRTLPTRFIRDNWEQFKRLYDERTARHEKDLLEQVTIPTANPPQSGILLDMLYQLIKFQGVKHRVSPKLIIPGKELSRMKAELNYIPPSFQDGWRRELLGKDLLSLLENRGEFKVSVKKNKFTLTVKKSPSLFSWFKRFRKEPPPPEWKPSRKRRKRK